jgi:sec-independent protein translocase protein TatC
VTNDPKVMSFREHLGELRSRLVKAILVLTVAFFVGWEYRVEIFDLLARPVTDALADHGIYRYQAIDIAESIMVYLKAVLVAAVAVTSPLTFYQLWAFVAPGLLDTEKRFLRPLTAFSVLFFGIGAAFCYTVILPFITDYLIGLTMDSGDVEVAVTMQNAYSTSFSFLLIFGFAFELPLVMFFLALFRIVDPRKLVRFFRYWIVLAFIIGGVFTPPDPFSQILMAVPLVLLYGLGILVAWGIVRSEGKGGADADRGARAAGGYRVMGAAIVLLGVALGLGILFMRLVPTRPLHEVLPRSHTAWVLGFNPQAVAQTGALDAALLREARAVELDSALRAAGFPLAEHTQAILAGSHAGGLALVIRAPDLGIRARRLEAAALDGMVAVVPDENTLAVCSPDFCEAVERVARGVEAPVIAEVEEARLLDRLAGSGPIWAWLPGPSGAAEPFIGEASVRDTVAVGAAIHLQGHLSEQPTRLAFELRARDASGVAGLQARFDTGRIETRSVLEGLNQDLWSAIAELAAALGPLAAPAAQERLEALVQRVTAKLGTPAPHPIPALAFLGPLGGGWALRANREWLTLTTELDDAALQTILARVLTPPRRVPVPVAQVVTPKPVAVPLPTPDATLAPSSPADLAAPSPQVVVPEVGPAPPAAAEPAEIAPAP